MWKVAPPTAKDPPPHHVDGTVAALFALALSLPVVSGVLICLLFGKRRRPSDTRRTLIAMPPEDREAADRLHNATEELAQIRHRIFLVNLFIFAQSFSMLLMVHLPRLLLSPDAKQDWDTAWHKWLPRDNRVPSPLPHTIGPWFTCLPALALRPVDGKSIHASNNLLFFIFLGCLAESLARCT